MSEHEHAWAEIIRTEVSVYSECPCGASKLVSSNSKGEA